VPAIGEGGAMTAAFDALERAPRWVCWRNETRNGKVTKVPHSPHGGPAKADDPRTWNTRSAAEARAHNLVMGDDGGIGIELGDLGDGTSLGGLDLDTCRSADGTFEPWAQNIIERFGSYAEISPSGTGAKIFFRYRSADLPRLRAVMGGSQHGKSFSRRNGADHPPAIELHLSNRYFAVTGQRVASSPDQIVLVDADILLWVLTEAGPAFAGATKPGHGGADKSRSATAFRKGAALRRAGKSYDEMVAALRAEPETAAWAREKGDAKGGREFRRIWKNADPATAPAGAVSLADFHAFMPMHNYIFTPTRALWPAGSVNSRIPPIPLTDPDGKPVLDKDGKPVTLTAAQWLDRFQPVEQMTWAPGLPEIIEDRLLYEGGWIDRPGARCFNQYLAPNIALGDAAQAGCWIELARHIFPDDAEHLFNWLAHRVQRPDEKINHALVLGGDHGIGKDTLLEPVKRAIGPWNFREASPAQLLGRFNGFLKAVILRVSEARDLGDFDRFQFYDHMKVYTAAPPDVLTVDEKHVREYAIVNCCGIVVTTNYKMDGIYLPDLRRGLLAVLMGLVRCRRLRPRRRLARRARPD
jgi:hypothetical protein